jgi:hypothetical protein
MKNELALFAFLAALILLRRHRTPQPDKKI